MADAATKAFLDAARSKQFVTYLDIVAAAVLAYDYILNVGAEAQFIWFSPLSLGKVLYFLTRYPVIADTSLVLFHQFAVMSPKQCDLVYKTIGYSLGTGTLIAESILVMRTWVIWSRNRTIGLTLLTGLIVCWIPVFYFLAQSLNSLVFVDPPNPNTPGCFLHTQKNILFVVWIIITGFESLILSLTLIRFAPTWRRKRTALLQIIYRDGILNYFYLCILSICNVVVLFTAPRGYTTLLSALQRVMHSILSSRVLLNLRQAANSPQVVTLPDSLHQGGHSGLLFQPNWASIFVTTQTETHADANLALSHIRPTRRHSDSIEMDFEEEDPYGKPTHRSFGETPPASGVRSGIP
ncbi:hypothetical protein BXZ70DRAFT_923349 [Cristinia sonorae]|uniref:DUF6533 domain-containing protein n=1 Tax=Cristinia sonorae TaxID=1940300 RepID=A0A8K0UUL4_9AGAR|nr:hypothetical protein BXZ70DRAFT_923349 [Cristinia sonorae]